MVFWNVDTKRKVFFIYTSENTSVVAPVCSLFLCISMYNIKNNRWQFIMGIRRLVEKESSKLLICKIMYQLIFNKFDQDLGLMSYM